MGLAVTQSEEQEHKRAGPAIPLLWGGVGDGEMPYPLPWLLSPVAGGRVGPSSWGWENCPCPSLSVALRRAGRAPCLGSIVELALVAKAWARWPEGVRERELAQLLSGCTLVELAKAGLEISPWLCDCGRAGRLTNSAITQTQIQGFELAHPNIYLRQELLECMKGPILQIQSCRITMAQVQQNIWEEPQWG